MRCPAWRSSRPGAGIIRNRAADYLHLLYVHRIISGHSAHPSELDIIIRDLIPKLRDTGDL